VRQLGKKKEIGLRIRTMRKSRGMTQEDLAKAIGQSPSSITMYETGRRAPDYETLEAFADIFNVPLTSLVSDEAERGNNPDEVPKNDEVRLLIRGLNQLSPEQLEQATNVMKAMFAKYADFFEKGKTTNDR
jgi:transcriptional regulator with XRE-family HTH domain